MLSGTSIYDFPTGKEILVFHWSVYSKIDFVGEERFNVREYRCNSATCMCQLPLRFRLCDSVRRCNLSVSFMSRISYIVSVKCDYTYKMSSTNEMFTILLIIILLRDDTSLYITQYYWATTIFLLLLRLAAKRVKIGKTMDYTRYCWSMNNMDRWTTRPCYNVLRWPTTFSSNF